MGCLPGCRTEAGLALNGTPQRGMSAERALNAWHGFHPGAELRRYGKPHTPLRWGGAGGALRRWAMGGAASFAKRWSYGRPVAYCVTSSRPCR